MTQPLPYFQKVKLGKKPAKIDSRLPTFARYLKRTIAPPPVMVNWSKGQMNWGMMGNDNLGDCAEAGAAHAVQCWTLNAQNSEVTLSDDRVIQFYSNTSGYDPANPSTDQGSVLTDVLSWWYTNSFSGHNISAYPVIDPKVTDHVKQAIALTGGVYVGILLPITAQTQSIWDFPSMGLVGDGAPGSWGGHCVYIVGYDDTHLYFITWGMLMLMTWDFFTAYCDEAYAPISPDWLSTLGLSPSGLDIATLEADTLSISNTPPPPQPDQPPQPQPQQPSQPQQPPFVINGQDNGKVDPSVLMRVHIGPMVIDIREAVVTWLVTIAGSWLVAHSKLDPTSVQTWLGGISMVVAGAFHLKRVHDSNIATVAYKGLVDKFVKK
jgi:hypothetical protein